MQRASALEFATRGVSLLFLIDVNGLGSGLSRVLKRAPVFKILLPDRMQENSSQCSPKTIERRPEHCLLDEESNNYAMPVQMLARRFEERRGISSGVRVTSEVCLQEDRLLMQEARNGIWLSDDTGGARRTAQRQSGGGLVGLQSTTTTRMTTTTTATSERQDRYGGADESKSAFCAGADKRSAAKSCARRLVRAASHVCERGLQNSLSSYTGGGKPTQGGSKLSPDVDSSFNNLDDDSLTTTTTTTTAAAAAAAAGGGGGDAAVGLLSSSPPSPPSLTSSMRSRRTKTLGMSIRSKSSAMGSPSRSASDLAGLDVADAKTRRESSPPPSLPALPPFAALHGSKLPSAEAGGGGGGGLASSAAGGERGRSEEALSVLESWSKLQDSCATLCQRLEGEVDMEVAVRGGRAYHAKLAGTTGNAAGTASAASRKTNQGATSDDDEPIEEPLSPLPSKLSPESPSQICSPRCSRPLQRQEQQQQRLQQQQQNPPVVCRPSRHARSPSMSAVAASSSRLNRLLLPDSHSSPSPDDSSSPHPFDAASAGLHSVRSLPPQSPQGSPTPATSRHRRQMSDAHLLGLATGYHSGGGGGGAGGGGGGGGGGSRRNFSKLRPTSHLHSHSVDMLEGLVAGADDISGITSGITGMSTSSRGGAQEMQEHSYPVSRKGPSSLTGRRSWSSDYSAEKYDPKEELRMASSSVGTLVGNSRRVVSPRQEVQGREGFLELDVLGVGSSLSGSIERRGGNVGRTSSGLMLSKMQCASSSHCPAPSSPVADRHSPPSLSPPLPSPLSRMSSPRGSSARHSRVPSGDRFFHAEYPSSPSPASSSSSLPLSGFSPPLSAAFSSLRIQDPGIAAGPEAEGGSGADCNHHGLVHSPAAEGGERQRRRAPALAAGLGGGPSWQGHKERQLLRVVSADEHHGLVPHSPGRDAKTAAKANRQLMHAQSYGDRSLNCPEEDEALLLSRKASPLQGLLPLVGSPRSSGSSACSSPRVFGRSLQALHAKDMTLLAASPNNTSSGRSRAADSPSSLLMMKEKRRLKNCHGRSTSFDSNPMPQFPGSSNGSSSHSHHAAAPPSPSAAAAGSPAEFWYPGDSPLSSKAACNSASKVEGRPPCSYWAAVKEAEAAAAAAMGSPRGIEGRQQKSSMRVKRDVAGGRQKAQSMGGPLDECGVMLAVLEKRASIMRAPLGLRFRDYYKVAKGGVGEGSYGTIRKCMDRKTKEIFASKILPKEHMEANGSAARVQEEINFLEMTRDHPHIIKMIESFEDDENVYIVMDLCEGGDLFDRVKLRKQFSESDAAVVCLKLVDALSFCHGLGIVHRDVKPENVLLCNKESDRDIKLIDFGIAALMQNEGEREEFIPGTPIYMAPEVFDGFYGPASDIWAAGVLLYILLSGVQPFWESKNQSLESAIKKKAVNFQFFKWEKVSSEAKDLVNRMLHKDPKKRISANEIKDHPWIKKWTTKEHLFKRGGGL